MSATIGYVLDVAKNQWVFPDGTRLPRVAGGSDEGDAVVVTVPAGTPSTQTAQPQTSAAPEARFTAEDLERVRKEEKEKLYGRIDKLQETLATLETEREERQRLEAEHRQREEEERKAREQEEMSVKQLLLAKEDEWKQQLNTVQSEWEERYRQIEEERNAQAAILEKERQFQALESYKQRRLQEEADNIMPELVDFVRGDTEEDLEAAISAVRDRTSAILSNVQAQIAPQRVIKPVPATGQAPNGPLENATEQQTVTLDQIKSMGMTEWAASRERLMAAVSRNR